MANAKLFLRPMRSWELNYVRNRTQRQSLAPRGEIMDAKELKTLAERCLRLAAASTDADLARQLREIAQYYLDKAQPLGDQPVTQQQQQQIQPDKKDE